MAEAIAAYEEAVRRSPANANAHCNLGVAYRMAGRLQDAAASYRRASECDPRQAEAPSNLSNLLLQLGQYDEAIAASRRAIELKPEMAEAHGNIGAALVMLGRAAEALPHFERAVSLKPRMAELRYNHARALMSLERIEDAIALYEQALRLKPDYAEAHSALGFALMRRGRFEASYRHCTRGVELQPQSAEAHRSLGCLLLEAAKPDQALPSLRRAVELNPAYSDARRSMAAAQAELGLVDEAMATCEELVRLDPDFETGHDTLLFLSNYSARETPESVFARHRQWGAAREARFAQQRLPHDNDRSPDRRLRIGYVSPDLRRHSVAFFIGPVLTCHDRSRFEIFCYSDVRNPDEVTAQLRKLANVWRPIVGQSDDAVAAQIRNDRIDILVELTVHSGSNRLLVLARKPAPVQATWIGYAGTTGMKAVDYRITDPVMDPPGVTERWHTEALFRLPHCSACYSPPPNPPAVSAPPVLTRNRITFGAFQGLLKVSPQAIALWCRVLQAVPGSRLLLKAKGLTLPAQRERVLGMFARHGVGADRVMTQDWEGVPQYLERFKEIDIALDTTPFTGGTSTCHCLWMGVPVVTLAGRTSVSRVGAAILANVGVPELIAETPQRFVEIAARLAADRPRLSSLRATLRDKVRRSPLLDAKGFVANLEAAYRAMWATWCGNP